MEKWEPPQSALACDHGLRRLDGSHSSLPDDALLSIGSIADHARSIGVGSVFIVPNSRASRLATTAPFWQRHEGWGVRGLHAARRISTSVQLYRAGERAVVVTDLARDDRWQVLAQLDATTIGNALRYVQDVLGSPPAYSPGHLGRRLLDAGLQKTDWLKPLKGELVDLQAGDMGWIGACPAGAEWYHTMDVNAAYLAVAADQSFGVGDPMAVSTISAAALQKVYGVFLVRATSADSRWDGVRLPSPFGAGPRRSAVGWYATPQVRAAIELGWQVEIVRGWVWPERHKVLSLWARRLWQGRSELASNRARYPNVAAAVAAVDVLKAIYTQTIALFTRPPTQNEEATENEEDRPQWARDAPWRFTRPDWRAWIIGECYRRRLWEIRHLAEAGRCPVAADVDALVVASRHADPVSAAPELRWGGLGGYKAGASVPVELAIRVSADGSPNAFVRGLQRVADGR